jgi:DNA transformation protein and related proteins
MKIWKAVTVSRFFGGMALSVDEVQFGFVMKGSLYLRVDEQTRAAFESRGASPFTYAGARKSVRVASYYEAPSEVVEDPELLAEWAAEAHRAALAALRARRQPTMQSRRKGNRSAR